jgi:hypothetical protein
MRGPTSFLVTHCAPKIKLITFINERGRISPLRFEGHFTTHVTEGVRMILTLPLHDENIINTILLHKTLHSKEHTTLETYHSEVRHTASSTVFLKHRLLVVA